MKIVVTLMIIMYAVSNTLLIKSESEPITDDIRKGFETIITLLLLIAVVLWWGLV